MQIHNSWWRICAWVLSLLVLGHSVALAESWLKVESDNFIIYSNAPEKGVRDRILKLEAFDQAADLLFSEAGDSEILNDHKHAFYLLNKIADFKTIDPKLNDSFKPEVSCYSFGQQNYSIFSNYNLAEPLSKQVNSEDISYLYRSHTQSKISKYFSFELPRWVQEGFKEYFMTLKVDKDRIYVGIPLDDLFQEYTTRDGKYSKAPIATSSLIPFEAIITNTYPPNVKIERVRLQWWVMVNHLMTDPVKREAFANYLQRYQKGEDSLTAFKVATGMKPEDFIAIYRDYAAKGAPYLTYPYRIVPESHISTTKLPDYGQPLPLLNSALSLSPCIKEAHGKSLLAEVRKIAIAFPGDELAAISVAKAETYYGDSLAAIAKLAPFADKAPDNAEAQHVFGKAYIAAADKAAGTEKADLMAKARIVLAKAYKLTPSSPSILYDLAQSRKNLPDYPDENTVTAAEVAWEYAANTNFRDYMGYYVAELYVRKDRYNDALAIMEPWLSAQTVPVLNTALQKIITGLKAKAPKAEILQAMTDYDKAIETYYASKT